MSRKLSADGRRAGSASELSKNIPEPAAVAALAYELWQGRGCPTGSPEIDWFQAEELLSRQSAGPAETELAFAAAGKG